MFSAKQSQKGLITPERGLRGKKIFKCVEYRFQLFLKARGVHSCLIWTVCFLLVNIRTSVPNCMYVLGSSVNAVLMSYTTSFTDSSVPRASLQGEPLPGNQHLGLPVYSSPAGFLSRDAHCV